MRVDEILSLIEYDTVVAVRQDKKVTLKSVDALLSWYGGEEDIHCEQIEPNGYTDLDGISYLTLHIYNIKDRPIVPDEELPFPMGV